MTVKSGESVVESRAKRAGYMRKWRARHPEKRKEACAATQKWRGGNPERQQIIQRVGNARKHAKKLGVENTLKTKIMVEILEEYNHLCAYCFAPWEHLDHVVPLSKGGGNTRDNVVPACATCNLRKGSNGGRRGWVPSIASRFWPKLAEEIYA